MTWQSNNGVVKANEVWPGAGCEDRGTMHARSALICRVIGWATVLLAAVWVQGLVQQEVSRLSQMRLERMVYRLEAKAEAYVFSDPAVKGQPRRNAPPVECRKARSVEAAAHVSGRARARVPEVVREPEVSSREAMSAAKEGLAVADAAVAQAGRMIPVMAEQSPDCLFCKIVMGAIPAKRLHETAETLAFADIHPQAPVHVLVIPKRHIASHAHALPEDAGLVAKLMTAAGEVAQEQGLANGYRLVVNTGPDGGQTVDHLHVHVLGGRHMGWPPG